MVVQRFVEGQLREDERSATEAHLAECSECRQLVSELARTGQAAAGADEVDGLDAVAETLSAGLVLGGRFVLERRLGGGGMGTVWAAQHQVTHQRVALKLVRGVVGERERKRFLREARVASSFEHPNITVARDAFLLDDGTPVLVLDLLVGQSLRERLVSGGPLPVAEAAAVLGDVAEVITAAHAVGVVHRDLKPDNIFLCDDGPARVKVLDFGIAKLRDGVSADITRTGDLLGTPYYMAPEQLFGESDIDGSADVWALGVTACECLTGRRPFDANGVGGLLKAIGSGEAPVLDAVAGLPDAVSRVIRQMLSVERRTRPEMSAVRAALAGWTAVGSSVMPSATVAGAVATDELPAKSSPRLRRRVAVGLVVVLVISAALGVLGWQWRRPASSPPVAVVPVEVPVEPAPVAPVAPAPIAPAPIAVDAPPPHVHRLPRPGKPEPLPVPDPVRRLPGGVIEKVPF